ncbi:hypothetical protein [Streptomyces sp. NPDC003077]|uniref:hypothetical protein n=1 Tax=Streptomyces sp. NPDC003077 TaxID=3154443 RepID=UPI0033B8C87B
MKNRRSALSCLVVVAVLLTAVALYVWWTFASPDEPIPGWLESPTQPGPSAPVSVSVSPDSTAQH